MKRGTDYEIVDGDTEEHIALCRARILLGSLGGHPFFILTKPALRDLLTEAHHAGQNGSWGGDWGGGDNYHADEIINELEDPQ